FVRSRASRAGIANLPGSSDYSAAADKRSRIAIPSPSPNFLLLSKASRGMNGRAAATCRLKGQFQMNASEKQNNDSLAGAPKVRSSKPAASKPAAKSIARANKPKHAKAIKKPKGRSKTPAATRRGTK